MDQEVIRRRNAVFSVIYRRVTSQYFGCVPQAIRWVLEITLLAMALAMLLLWSFVHFTYVVEPQDCLVEIIERPFPYEDILQVEVYTNTTDLWSKRQALLIEMYASLSTIDMDNFAHTNHPNEWTEKEQEEREEEQGDDKGWLNWILPGEKEKERIENNSFQGDMQHTASSYMEQHTLYELFDVYTLNQYCMDYTILEFSQEPGYLSLTQSARARLNISTRRLYINPENTTCFGGEFGQFITKYFLGYEMMIIASFKNLLPQIQGSGYVKNLLTGSHYYYRIQWMGKWRYIAGLLPALFFTLVASVLLRQIHYHVFKFLTHFHHLLNEGVPMPIQTGAQVPFLIITYAAIGLVVVMSEALGDDSMFSLLMVATVWEADQFYAVFCRHRISKIFFPMFFFLYHFIPYAYFVRFNGQFWFIPFIFHWLMMQNAMLFFFHHFEQPIGHHGGQEQIHQPQQQEQHGPPPHQIFQDQQPPLGIHPQPSLVEPRYQAATGIDLPQSPYGNDAVAVRQASLSIPQSVSHVYRDTENYATPGSPIEESSGEEGRSALFISTQTSPQGENSGTALGGQLQRQTVTDMRGRPDRQGLRERRLIHFDNTVT